MMKLSARNSSLVPVLLIITGLLTGCANNTIPMEPVYSANDCAISEQTVKIIENQEQLDKVIKSRSLFPASDRAATIRGNFDREQLILVAMGNKPTTGYSIEWSNDSATLENGELHLPVALKNPPSKQMQAQVITSPCRIFSIPKTEFQQIKLSPIQKGK